MINKNQKKAIRKILNGEYAILGTYELRYRGPEYFGKNAHLDSRDRTSGRPGLDWTMSRYVAAKSMIRYCVRGERGDNPATFRRPLKKDGEAWIFIKWD